MPRTFGEWLFLVSIGVFCILGAVNSFVAGVGLFGSIALGARDGFDKAIIIGIVLFGVLFVGEIVDALFAKPERILKSVLPNALASVIRLIWLLFAALLFYGLYIDGGLATTKYNLAYLIVAILLTIANTPSMFFHAALCYGKWRKSALETYEDLQKRVEASKEQGAR